MLELTVVVFALVAVIVALVAERSYLAVQHARERHTLIAAVLAETPAEFAVMDREPPPQPKKKIEPIREQVGI